jgi:hypothetical protein
MGHRLDVASGKNQFDRRLGNFRVQIKLDDEGSHPGNPVGLPGLRGGAEGIQTAMQLSMRS